MQNRNKTMRDLDTLFKEQFDNFETIKKDIQELYEKVKSGEYKTKSEIIQRMNNTIKCASTGNIYNFIRERILPLHILHNGNKELNSELFRQQIKTSIEIGINSPISKGKKIIDDIINKDPRNIPQDALENELNTQSSNILEGLEHVYNYFDIEVSKQRKLITDIIGVLMGEIDSITPKEQIIINNMRLKLEEETNTNEEKIKELHSRLRNEVLDIKNKFSIEDINPDCTAYDVFDALNGDIAFSTEVLFRNIISINEEQINKLSNLFIEFKII